MSRRRQAASGTRSAGTTDRPRRPGDELDDVELLVRTIALASYRRGAPLALDDLIQIGRLAVRRRTRTRRSSTALAQMG
jgi:hypothetical protein